jgi:hypothetical protein
MGVKLGDHEPIQPKKIPHPRRRATGIIWPKKRRQKDENTREGKNMRYLSMAAENKVPKKK